MIKDRDVKIDISEMVSNRRCVGVGWREVGVSAAYLFASFSLKELREMFTMNLRMVVDYYPRSGTGFTKHTEWHKTHLNRRLSYI